MSQETINLILGAMIGIIPTLLITWINHRNQEKKDRQARTWQMEDLFFNRKAAHLERRLAQIEDFFSKAIVIVSKLAFITLDTAPDAFLYVSDKTERGIDFLRDNTRQIIGVSNAIKDEEIGSLTQALVIEIEHVIQVYDAIQQIQANSSGERLDDVVELRKRMSKLRMEVTNLYGKLLHSMDYWRTNLRPDREDLDDRRN